MNDIFKLKVISNTDTGKGFTYYSYLNLLHEV